MGQATRTHFSLRKRRIAKDYSRLLASAESQEPTRKRRIASANSHLQERRALDLDALSAVELELSHVELSGLGHGTLVVWGSRPAAALPHADVAVYKRGVTGC
jgi:hypothetical protein